MFYTGLTLARGWHTCLHSSTRIPTSFTTARLNIVSHHLIPAQAKAAPRPKAGAIPAARAAATNAAAANLPAPPARDDGLLALVASSDLCKEVRLVS